MVSGLWHFHTQALSPAGYFGLQVTEVLLLVKEALSDFTQPEGFQVSRSLALHGGLLSRKGGHGKVIDL